MGAKPLAYALGIDSSYAKVWRPITANARLTLKRLRTFSRMPHGISTWR